jgi:septal ring factor EnvC (AmiA/AmiB activator)
VETAAAGIFGSLLGSLGVFGGILAFLVLLIFLWMRWSRELRQDTETAIARKARDLDRKNDEIAELHEERDGLKKEVKELQAENRRLHIELLECRYPDLKEQGPEVQH